jgi:hypothetical protein
MYVVVGLQRLLQAGVCWWGSLTLLLIIFPFTYTLLAVVLVTLPNPLAITLLHKP